MRNKRRLAFRHHDLSLGAELSSLVSGVNGDARAQALQVYNLRLAEIRGAPRQVRRLLFVAPGALDAPSDLRPIDVPPSALIL
jgi:hypothetical protein